MNVLRRVYSIKPKNYWSQVDEFYYNRDIEKVLKVDLKGLRVRFTLFFEPVYDRLFIRINTYCPKCGKTLISNMYKFKKDFTDNTLIKFFRNLYEVKCEGVHGLLTVKYNMSMSRTKRYNKIIKIPLSEDLNKIFNSIVSQSQSVLINKHMGKCKRIDSLIESLDVSKNKIKQVKKRVLKERIKFLQNSISDGRK